MTDYLALAERLEIRERLYGGGSYCEAVAALREAHAKLEGRRQLEQEKEELNALAFGYEAEGERLRALLRFVCDQDSTPLWIVERIDAELGDRHD